MNRTPAVEHHRRDQDGLQPRVRHPMRHQRGIGHMQHGDGECRQRQYRGHNHQLRQRLDLIGAFSRLPALPLRRIHGGRCRIRSIRMRKGRVLIRAVLSLNPQQPMHHIHAARKRILARRQRRQFHVGGGVARQHGVKSQISKHHMRGAFAGLLPVKGQCDRRTRTHAHHGGGVPALDGDRRGLAFAGSVHGPGRCLLRSEEEPQDQPCQCGRHYQRRGGREDAELHNCSFSFLMH